MIGRIPTLGILLFLSGLSFVSCKLWEPAESANEEVCRTEKCIKRGFEYFENLNPTVHPCDDFYSFACGTWFVAHKAPEFASDWSLPHVMKNEIIKDLREILEKPVSTNEPELIQVKYFYDICMKQPFLGKLDPKEVGNLILRIGRFGTKTAWEIHEEYLRLTSESALFDFSLYAYIPKDYIPLLFLREPESAYGAIIHDWWKSEEEKVYTKFLFVLAKTIRLPGLDDDIKKKIGKVLQFRHRLNAITKKSRNREHMQSRPMTAFEFEKWFSELGKKKTRISPVPWEKILKTILAVVPKEIHNQPIITMRERKYFADLYELLTKTPQEVLINHMEFYFAERHTKFTSILEDLVEKTSIEPNRLLDYIREEPPRWELCIRQHNMWTSIGRILQQKWFRRDISARMTELVNGIKLAIASQIKESTWLDYQTKGETIKRIVDVNPWVGYPPWYSDPSTLEFDMGEHDPLQPNAILDIAKHVIFIKSPMLRSPIYDPDMPNVYNLGATGYIVGHELYHVLYNCGMLQTVSKKPLAWWPPEMREICKKKIKCFVDAFSRQTHNECAIKYHINVEASGKKTYHEDYADVMGLDAAYRLYQLMVKKDPSVCQTLPRFGKYSCDQMFFIAFANSMCSKTSAKAARQFLEVATHSLDSVRVNGAVQNNEHFQRAFDCPVASPMNPPKKCNLWA